MYYTGLRTVFFFFFVLSPLGDSRSVGGKDKTKGNLCFEKTIVVQKDLWFHTFP